MPLVQTLRYISDIDGDYSGTDYAGGMRLAVDHLTALGHRSIAFVTGGPMHSAYAERLDGFRSAMQGHGLAADLIIDVPLTPSGSTESAKLLLDSPAKPTAAICFNDIAAAGLASGLIDLGVTVGKDVSVVGFDDLAVAETVRPRLSIGRDLSRRDRGGGGAAAAGSAGEPETGVPADGQPAQAVPAAVDRTGAGAEMIRAKPRTTHVQCRYNPCTRFCLRALRSGAFGGKGSGPVDTRRRIV